MGHIAPPPQPKPTSGWVIFGRLVLGCFVVLVVFAGFIVFMCSQH